MKKNYIFKSFFSFESDEGASKNCDSGKVLKQNFARKFNWNPVMETSINQRNFWTFR